MAQVYGAVLVFNLLVSLKNNHIEIDFNRCIDVRFKLLYTFLSDKFSGYIF